MKKRSSKKEDYFETLRLHKQSINTPSPVKNTLPR